MRNIIFIILSVGIFGCGSPKYVSNFNKQYDALDFSKGKWILNNAIEKEESRIQDVAERYFKEILGDSLKLIDEVKNTGYGLMKAEIPFNPSKEQLREILVATDCDYLINIKGIVLKDEFSGFVGGTHYGSTVKTNMVKVELNIYDLEDLKLLSGTSIIGKYKRKINADDNFNWTIVADVKTIKIGGVSRLIRKYKKNQKRTNSKK